MRKLCDRAPNIGYYISPKERDYLVMLAEGEWQDVLIPNKDIVERRRGEGGWYTVYGLLFKAEEEFYCCADSFSFEDRNEVFRICILKNDLGQKVFDYSSWSNGVGSFKESPQRSLLSFDALLSKPRRIYLIRQSIRLDVEISSIKFETKIQWDYGILITSMKNDGLLLLADEELPCALKITSDKNKITAALASASELILIH